MIDTAHALSEGTVPEQSGVGQKKTRRNADMINENRHYNGNLEGKRR